LRQPGPSDANAAAKTAHVWWTQGFIAEEDAAFKNVVAAYEKASGNILDVSIIPFGPMMQKIVSALTSGDVPDIMQNFTSAVTIVPQNAWNDKLVDVTDVMETQKTHFHPTALLSAQYYNSVTKKRGFYLVPDRSTVLPFHIWNSLVEKAGFKMSDAPKTWDAFWDFFKPMQKELRGKGMRGLYALGLQPTTTGPADGNNMFHYFLSAYGGNALSWNDADDNNAFHAKQILMALDGTISIELALYHKKEQYDDIVTMGLPNDNAGKPVASQLLVGGAYIPKGAKNIAVSKDFLKYLIQPQVSNDYLKAGLGRWIPPIAESAKTDPFWLDPSDPHRSAYIRQGVLEPTVANYPAFNPGYAEANAQQIWGAAEADVIREGMTPEAAADKALKRIGAILAKYPIAAT
jgi:multiple sugar transport system substrate-binding protein